MALWQIFAKSTVQMTGNLSLNAAAVHTLWAATSGVCVCVCVCVRACVRVFCDRVLLRARAADSKAFRNSNMIFLYLFLRLSHTRPHSLSNKHTHKLSLSLSLSRPLALSLSRSLFLILSLSLFSFYLSPSLSQADFWGDERQSATVLPSTQTAV